LNIALQSLFSKRIFPLIK